MDWIEITGRWQQLSGKFSGRRENLASDGAADDRELSKCAVPENGDAKEQVKKLSRR